MHSRCLRASRAVPYARRWAYEQLRLELRLRHNSLRTERAYVGWVERYVAFHDRRPSSHARRARAQKVMASLLYGSGLRLLECARLRIYTHVLNRGPFAVRSPLD